MTSKEKGGQLMLNRLLLLLRGRFKTVRRAYRSRMHFVGWVARPFS